MTIPDVVVSLQDVLGSRLATLIAGESRTEILKAWGRGEAVPDLETQQRLRDTLAIVQLLLREESPAAIRSWFVGMNPELDDRAPVLVLAEEPELVAEAARIFVATG
jgi:hypothetical protein